MIPYPSSGLKMLADRVLSTVLPELGNQFVMSDTALLAMLVTALSAELESGIAKRMIDIEEMGSIFSVAKQKGFKVPELTPLGAEQLTMSGVNEQHDRCTQAIITLHASLDENETDLDQMIWNYLASNAERHQLPI